MKKILLSLASLLIAGGAWGAQNYSLKSFEVTTDESAPITYVMESLRQGYGFPEWWYDSSENKVKTKQGGEYSATVENNHFLWYFTDAGDGKYYIHPYGAQSGYVLGAEEIANDAEVIAVDKNATTAIKWTLATSEGYPCFSIVSDGQTYYLHDYFDDGTKRSDKSVLKDATSATNFRGYTFTFGKFDPITTATKDDLSNLINSFDYKIAYQCLGTETGQFVDAGNAYETAYEAAQAAITAETGDFETLLANVQTAYEALVYSPLPTGKFYTFKSKSTDKYLAPNAPGSAMKMSDDIAVFELTAETWMEMCANGIWINGVNHGRGGSYHNTNKFYRVAADGSFIIAATPTDAIAHAILKAGDANLTSVADNAIDEACYWVVEEYTVPAVTVNATNEYATFYAPAAVAVPEGVVAYYVSEVNGNSATLTEIETNIPANTGAILYAEGGKECNFTVVSYNAGDAVDGNLLVGTQSETTVTKEAGYSYYILANVAGVVGFYNAVNGVDEDTFVNAAGKAYLKVADVVGARFLNFNFGGTETAIKDIEGAESNSVVYDLSGRRVQNVTKGLYIVNGKKVVK